MFKFRRWVCLALVCAMVGVAYGAARKIRSFTPMGAELATADGMAILNLADGGVDGQRTILQVVVSGFTPNSTYYVGVCLPPIPPYFPGTSCLADEIGQSTAWIITDPAMTTDEDGSGTFHYQFPGDHSSANVGIYLRNPDGTIPAGGYLRALGNP